MRLNIVNAQELNIVYSILDFSPELNLPNLKDGEELLLGRDLNALSAQSAEDISARCLENGFVYSLYVRELELEDTISYNRKIEIVDFYQDYSLSTLIEELKAIDLFKIASSHISQDNWHDIEAPEMIVDGRWTIFTEDSLSSYYNKVQSRRLTIDLVPGMNQEIYNLTSMIHATYIYRDDVLLPDIAGLSTLQDFFVPEPFDLYDDFAFPELSFSADFEAPSTLVANRAKWDRKLSSMELAVDAMKPIIDFRSCARLCFRTWDAFYQRYTVMDSATIDMRPTELLTGAGLSGLIVQYVEDICPSIYNLRLSKQGYGTVRLKMKTEVNIPANVQLFDIGTINLIKQVPRPLKLWFEWGHFPVDLDVHIFSFDRLANGQFEMHEHCCFMDRRTTTIALDRDDTDAFGPEVITLEDFDMWYLISVHNYTYSVYNERSKAHMNIDGKTFVKTNFYGKQISLAPVDSDQYWWDACMIHKNMLYVLDDFPADRVYHYGQVFTDLMIKRVQAKALASPESYDIQAYRPKNIIELDRH